MIDVIILAGGVGSRLKSAVPKQFIEIDGCPIIVYTIKNFQDNPNVDQIIVVCLGNWIEHTKSIVKKYGLDKVTDVIPGGMTGHISTKNGVYCLKNRLSEEDYVIIHDAARPIVSQEVINDLIETAKKNGNACSAVSCYETVVLTENRFSGKEQIDRNRVMRVQTPQCYNYGLIKNLYEKAEADKREDFVYANILAMEYGVEIFFSKGTNNNIKITTKEDIALFRALLYYINNAEGGET